MNIDIVKSSSKWIIGIFLFWLLILCPIELVYDGQEPSGFDVYKVAMDMAKHNKEPKPVIGQVTTATMAHLIQVLLNKPGGFISNDKFPPTAFMDNMPAFELGAMKELRIVANVFRNNFSRSQTQSAEDKDLIDVDTLLTTNTDFWLFPSAESQYSKALKALEHYFDRLGDDNDQDAQFYARADNLAVFLDRIGIQLGGISQSLSANVGQERLNTDLDGDPSAKKSTPTPASSYIKTKWSKVDDEWWQARGKCWVILHILKAEEYDFASVLEDKHAVMSFKQIVRELEATQHKPSSSIVLNGSGLGYAANYSLYIGQHIAVANAAIIDIKDLLHKG